MRTRRADREVGREEKREGGGEEKRKEEERGGKKKAQAPSVRTKNMT